MPRKSEEKNAVNLSLSQDEKERLEKLAEEYGHATISKFVAAIANGKYRIMSKDACELVDKLLGKSAARKARYEESKAKEKESEHAND